MKNGLCPDYLTSCVPATVCSASAYSLRNSPDLQTLHTNSRLYFTSFLRLLSVIGMNFQSKLAILPVLTSLKTD